MTVVSQALAVSMSIVTFIVGLTAGYFITPSYQQSMYTKADMGLGKADRFVDLRYMDLMAAHHKGAILLADQAMKNSHRTEIRNLAKEIQINEPKLIATLTRWKQEWYNNSTPAPEPEVASLGEADDTFDLRFLNALIAHHDAGIEMARDLRTKSSRSSVLDDADAVENFLAGSLVTLKDWRKQWYNVQ